MIRTLLVIVTALATAACAATPDAKPPTQPAPADTPTNPNTTTGIDPQQAAQLAPLGPAQLTASADAAGQVRLSWPTTGEDIAYYQLLRRTPPATTWEPIGRTNPDTLTYLDPNPGPGKPVYGVQAVNTYGTASAITETSMG